MICGRNVLCWDLTVMSCESLDVSRRMQTTGKIRIFFVAGLFAMLKYLTASGIYFTILIILQVRYVHLSEVFTLSIFM
jgi:hypothetical protein